MSQRPRRPYRLPFNPRNHVLGAREGARDMYRAGQPRSPLSLAPQKPKRARRPARRAVEERSAPAPAPRQTPAPRPPIEKQFAPAQTIPSKKEETDFAIEAAAQELKKDHSLTRDELYERLFGPKDKRASSLKKKVWITPWTMSRFKRKVWKLARESAGLSSLAPKGRPPEK